MIKKLRITVAEKKYDVTVEILDDSVATPQPSAPQVPQPQVSPTPPTASGGNQIPSPLAGKVVSIDVSVGQVVNNGDTLMTLEAMKMNTYVTASNAGTIKAIHAKAGDEVAEGEALITLS